MNSNQSHLDSILKQVEKGEVSVDEAEALLVESEGSEDNASRQPRRRGWSVDELVALAANGVEAEGARAIQGASGKDLGVQEVVALSANGVTPELLKALVDAGLDDLSVHEIIGLSLNAITPAYVRESAELGDLAAADLLALRTSGIAPAQILPLQQRGLGHLSIHELIGLSLNGADTEFIDELRAEGSLNQSGAQLIALAAQRQQPIRAKKRSK